MRERSKRKKAGREAKARPPSDRAAWDRPARTPLHGGFTGRQAARPQSNFRQGRGR